MQIPESNKLVRILEFLQNCGNLHLSYHQQATCIREQVLKMNISWPKIMSNTELYEKKKTDKLQNQTQEQNS